MFIQTQKSIEGAFRCRLYFKMCRVCVTSCKPTNFKKKRHFENSDNIIFQVNLKWANSNTTSILIETNLTDTFNLNFAIQNGNTSPQVAPKMRNPYGWRYTHEFRIAVQSGSGRRSWFSDPLLDGRGIQFRLCWTFCTRQNRSWDPPSHL